MRFRIAALVSVLLLAVSAQAAESTHENRDTTVSVVGTATLKLPPDQATVPIIVSTEDEDMEKSKQLNDKKVKKLLALAEHYGVAKDDIQTTYNSVEPQMGYGDNVTVETDVYTGNVSYNMDVKGLAQDKIDALAEALQKADLDNVNQQNHLPQYAHINASYRVSDDKIEVVRDKLKANQDAVIKIATANGIARDKISMQTNQSKGKERHAQPNKPHVEKYKTVMSLNFVMKDKDKAVDFVNDAIKEGADNIGSITFSLRDEKTVQDKAALEALKDAKRKAGNLADAVGWAIDRPITLAANDGQIIPMQPYPMVRMAAMNGMADAAAPAMAMQSNGAALPSGLIEVRASVSATFLLKQK
jgi:uncharacterized protein YggE